MIKTEFYRAFKYFFLNFPRRTTLVFLASGILALLELVSLAMVLPLFSAGVSAEAGGKMARSIEAFFVSLGITFDFYQVFFVFISAFILKVICELFLGIFVANSSVRISRRFREDVINALQRLSWEYLTDKPHGLLVNLLSQEVDRAAGLFSTIKLVTMSAFMAVTYVVLAAMTSYQLLLIIGLMAVAGFSLARPMMTMARRAGVGHVESLRNLSSDLNEGLQAFKAFKAMGREGQLFKALASANDDFFNANLLKTKAEQFLAASQQIVMVICLIVVVLVGRVYFDVSLIEIGFMAVVLMRLSGSLSTLLKKAQAVGNTYYSLEKFDEFCSDLEWNSEVRLGKLIPNFPAQILFRKVDFWRGKRKILNSVDLDIPEKGLTMIVGPSGAGKTTLLDLICGFLQPDGGEIIVGGLPLSQIDIVKWREGIGYVSQEPVLLRRSIAANIAAFDDSLSLERISQALEDAGGGELSARLENGLQTEVGNSGSRLSGGERQRITIARALAKAPKILILDEPTASVDHATELEIVDTVRKIAEFIPVISISHQTALSSISSVCYELRDGVVRKTK